MAALPIDLNEAVLMEEIADRMVTQKQLACTYALVLDAGEAVNWERVNHAIIERWSETSLRRVKTMAWKRLEPREVSSP